MKVKHMAAYPKRYAAFFSDVVKAQGLVTLREFENWINRMIGPAGIQFKNEDDRNKFKGDALEVLSELFFMAFKYDPKVGLTNYEPITVDEDYGSDATGFNANNVKAAVQVKYRSNPADISTYPTYAEISRTFASGVCLHGISPTAMHTVFVFTNAKDVYHTCYKVLGERLVIVNREIIERFIDNNVAFWLFAAGEAQAYLTGTTNIVQAPDPSTYTI